MNGTYHLIFYRHDCPHCQRIVPATYVHNKMRFNHNIQYRDIAENKPNFKLSNDMNVKLVPSLVTAKISHGKIIHTKVKPMTQPE